MDVYLEIAGNQIDGDRDYQEDAFLTTYIDDEKGESKSTALIVMADGMGGHAAGNIASQMVVNTFNREFTSRFGTDEVPLILREALDKSNESLRASVKETPGLEGMGCTMVTAAISNRRLWWISVGDSHLYLVRKGKLSKQNADHSYGGYLDRMAAKGTPVEPEPGLSRNMLMSAIMGEELGEVDCREKHYQLQPGDRIIVASDGLDTISTDTVLKLSAQSVTPRDCVAALLNAVEDANKPRQDNTTVVVCDVIEREKDKPRPGPAPKPDAYAERYRPAAERPGAGRLFAMLGLAAVLAAVAASAWFLLDRDEIASRFERITAPAVDEPPPVEEEAVEPEPEPEPVVAAEPEPVSYPTFRDRLGSGGSGPLMVSLPGGSFMMGTRGSPFASERPHHEATVPAFAVSVYEVTFAEYDRFARATGRPLPDSQGLDRSRHPVFGVSWHDAAAYAEWLSRETGRRYRLPSESQWEYAAAAGINTPYWWGFRLGQNRAHCFNCTPGLDPRLPTGVGSFAPNPFGLYDTVGNVAEWVQDCYHPSYEGAPADGSVWEGGDCSVRVVRGGHFSSPAPTARARDTRRPDGGYPDVGIRVVREP